MLLLPVDQVVLVRLRLLVAERARLQGDEGLLPPSSPSAGAAAAGRLALLDLPHDETVFQKVLDSRRRGAVIGK